MTVPTRLRLPSTMLGRMRKSVRRVCAALLAVLVALGGAAADDLRLAPGDTIRIMVVGAPELSLEAPIEADGSVWFPLVGPIAAGGKTLRDVRESTSEAFATMSLGQPVTPDGGLPRIIDKSQVYVTVAAYRPIYLTGDIPDPREIPFRQGLTLRHVMAIAMAEDTRLSGRPAPTDEELQAAATALALEYARVWRLKTFLGTDIQADYDRIFVPGAGELEDLVAMERSILDQTRHSIEEEKQRLREEVSRTEARIDVLARQKDNESAGLKMDEEDLARVRDGYERGIISATRLADVRRAALVTSSRALDIDVALESARGQASKANSEILKTETDARIGALTELGQAVVRVQQRRADLASLLASARMVEQQSLGWSLTASVVRDGMTLAANDAPASLALMPGDIVEIHFQPRDAVAQPDGTGAKW